MSDKPKPDIRVCEIATDGGLGAQIGEPFTSKRAAERYVEKEFDDADGKHLLIVKIVRRIKLVQKRETVVHTAIEDAPPV